MKCVASILVLCLVALATAQSAQSTCNAPSMLKPDCSMTINTKPGEWQKAGIGGYNDICYLLSYDADESAAGELFFLAVRPEDENGAQVSVYAYQNTTHYP